MEKQIKIPYIAIILGWVLFGFLFGYFMLFYIGFLAGGSFLMAVMSIIFIVIAPPINIALFKYQKYQGENKLLVSVIITFSVMLFAFFVLVASGIFNFT